MTKGASLLAISALFLSGVAIGALGMHLYYAEKLVRPGAPPAMAVRFGSAHLERRLDLTDEQRLEIRRILEESRHESASFRQRMRPEIEALMDRTRERVEEVLTADQRRVLEEIRRVERRGLERLFLGPAPHPPDPGDRRGRWRDRGQRQHDGPEAPPSEGGRGARRPAPPE